MSQRLVVYSLILIVVCHEAAATMVVALTDRSPLELGLGIFLGSTGVAAAIALVLAPKKLWPALKGTPGRIINRPFGLMLLSRFDWPVLASGAYLIGITPMAIIWALKPVMFILCLRRLVYANDGRRAYRAPVRTAWIWLGLAAVGIVLVAVGRPGQAGAASNWLLVCLGVLAGLASTTLAGLSGIRLEWGRQLAPNRSRIQLAVITAGLALVGLPVSLVGLLIFGFGGAGPDWSGLWPGMIVGAIIASGWTIATVAWLRVKRLEVGGLFYLTPPLSVLLLLLVGRLGEINPWLVGAGGLLVLGASLALVRTDRRLA